LNKLARNTTAIKVLRGHFGEDDGILVSADRTPNLRGALVSGFVAKYPSESLSEISSLIQKNDIDCLLVINEDLLSSGINLEVLNGIKIIYIGTHTNPTSEIADIVLPSLTAFEKSGSFINRNFRLQTFKQAIPGPAGLLPDLNIIASIINGVQSEKNQSFDLNEIWKQLSKSSTNPLHKIVFSDIPSEGIQLDGSRWSSLKFVEKEALHFSPTQNC
jgi:NADH-quinone oxidoreductase subunit G